MSTDSTPDAIVGVISDTHGRLDPRVAAVFADVDRILHAGDIGSAAVLLELETMAPVTAVLGNTDRDIPGYTLGFATRLEISGVPFVLTHKPKQLEKSGLLAGAGVAVNGHTHAPSIAMRHGVLHVNPGTASGHQVGGDRPTVALVEVRGGSATARIVEL